MSWWAWWHLQSPEPHNCLLDRLFRRRSKKTSKLRVTGVCAGNSPVTGEFPSQRASWGKYFHLMTSSWCVCVYVYIYGGQTWLPLYIYAPAYNNVRSSADTVKTIELYMSTSHYILWPKSFQAHFHWLNNISKKDWWDFVKISGTLSVHLPRLSDAYICISELGSDNGLVPV